MGTTNRTIEQADNDMLVRVVMDGFHRILVHYGAWMAEVAHQVGLEQAMAVEEEVWTASLGNQMDRLGKTLGFAVDNGVPGALAALPREALVDLVEKLSINWLANDGIWFRRWNAASAWARPSGATIPAGRGSRPSRRLRIKKLLGLPERGGIPALKQALALRMYAFINEQSIEDWTTTASSST